MCRVLEVSRASYYAWLLRRKHIDKKEQELKLLQLRFHDSHLEVAKLLHLTGQLSDQVGTNAYYLSFSLKSIFSLTFVFHSNR